MVAGALAGGLLALGTTLPLAWKWRLGVARAAAVVLALALAAALLTALVDSFSSLGFVSATFLVWGVTVALAFAFVAYRFYRDPERQGPDRDDVVVSPADGEVVYIRPSVGGLLPVSTKLGRSYRLDELTKTALRSEDAIVIGIALNFLDVHVNRAPISGRVTLQRHFPGRFGSLRLTEMVFENERATIVIEKDGLQVAVVMIASRLVRRIVSFVRESQELALAERIGVIRFGSQVDLVIPAEAALQLTVEVGDRVVAGESILAVLGADEDPTSLSGSRRQPAVSS